MASKLIEISLQRWTSQQRLNKALFAMLVYYEGNRKGPPQSFDQDQFKDRRFEFLVHEAVAQHKARVRNNNGIREKDLCEILFPIGFSYTDLDTALVASLDSFGQRRGTFAHQSLPKAIAATQIDPFVEAATIQNIITEIAKVDVFFDALAK